METTFTIKEKEFAEAYQQYEQPLFRYCFYRVSDKDLARDMVQEAFFRIWKHIVKGNQIENLKPFLYRTANNIIINESKRKKSCSLNMLMEKGFHPSIDIKKTLEDALMHKELIIIIDSLDETYRKVIVMKYFSNFSSKEIAAATNKSEENVYVILHRGLKKAKAILEQNNTSIDIPFKRTPLIAVH